MSSSGRPFVGMTVAGSDSGGGAGIQADLKTFAAHGVYGTSVVTAVTAQNTVAVTGVEELSTEIIARQIDAVATDIGVHAVKTGMLSSSGIIETAAARLAEHRLDKLVVDPVMVAKSGDRLLAESAVEAVKERLLPMALVVTPNLPEAETLAGMSIASEDDAREAARRLVGLGARAAVVKGGHGEGAESVDILYWNGRFRLFRAPRVASRCTHGTGCTFSAAIAAGLARGLDLERSVERAKAYVTQALERGVDIGAGHGPVDHFVGCTSWPGPR